MRPPKIAFVCQTRDVPGVERLLNRDAHKDWKADGRIRIIAINGRKIKQADSVSNSLFSVLQDPRLAVDVVFLEKMRTTISFGGGSVLWTSLTFRNLRDFGNNLPQLLEKHGLDWLSAVETILKNGWHHGTIDRAYLKLWTEQFRKVDGSEWVAELLLKRLDFWGDQRLLNTLQLSAKTFAEFDCVAVNRKKVGKSADAISNLIVKRIAGIDPKKEFVFDFYDVLQDPAIAARMQRILYVEDGLFTGTEIGNYLKDLFGVARPNRKPKFAPLADRPAFDRKVITMRFPVSTSLGVSRLKKTLTEQKISNIMLSCPPEGFIETMTEDGHKAFAAGTFYRADISNCPADSKAHIRCHALEGLNYWKASKQPERVERATDICREIGSQLFANYLQRVGYTDWPAAKIAECGLGMHGLGLALGFSHSIPKAALPLFWGSGEVQVRGNKFPWLPLFANAT